MADMYIFQQSNSPSRASNGVWAAHRGTRDGAAFTADYLHALGQEGRLFFASDADQNDTVTGQTSFVNTTPTFLLNVPSGTTALPLYMGLVQAGTVAGGAVDILMEIDNANRYSSGGTAETVLSSRTDQPVTNACTLYSGATASAGYGVGILHILAIPQDVAPAITEIYQWHQFFWAPPLPIYLVGPAAWCVYTYAGTTGPTWNWSFGWGEIPSSMIT